MHALLINRSYLATICQIVTACINSLGGIGFGGRLFDCGFLYDQTCDFPLNNFNAFRRFTARCAICRASFAMKDDNFRPLGWCRVSVLLRLITDSLLRRATREKSKAQKDKEEHGSALHGFSFPV